MIKVNLLKDQTVRVQKSFTKPKVTRLGLVYIAVFLIAAAAMGTWYLYVERQIVSQTQIRDKLRQDEANLRKLNTQVAKYEKLTQQRQSRIDLIEKLKENQNGPVLLLNTIIQGIPQNGDFRLTELEQKAEKVKIDGITHKPEAIPELMAKLMTSGIFASVDLEVMERQEDVSKFSLICINAQKTKAELRHGSK
jgi:Tfp pilus assembly protein PilN